MINPLLAGLHDREGAPHVAPGGWCLDLIETSKNPTPVNYAQVRGDLNWIGRFHWQFGEGGGCVPPDDGGASYRLFAYDCERYAAATKMSCTTWIIGNEPNRKIEGAVTPDRYAECYRLCRKAIRNVQPLTRVLVAGPGPWNAETKYPGNERGDWVKYLADVLAILGPDGYDGVALHSYCHTLDPASVRSEQMMNQPFDDRRYEFRAFWDFMAVIPPGKYVYITEACPVPGWRATGMIPAMLEEVSHWNNMWPRRAVQSLIFYRYPPFDANQQWCMSCHPDVMAEYDAAQRRYPAPVFVPAPFVMPDLPAWQAVVKIPVANIRQGPGTSFPAIRQAQFGDALTVRQSNIPGWLYVVPNAYIYAELVTAPGEQLAMPPPPPATTGILDPLVAAAILEVESGGAGFNRDGSLKIRFEAHVFERELGDQARFDRCFRYDHNDPLQAWYRLADGDDWLTIHTGRAADEYAALKRAVEINENAAYRSISMGAPQIMGFHAEGLGYKSARAMFEAFRAGEPAQMVGFFNFCLTTPGLLDAMRSKDFGAVARLYNGNEELYRPRLEAAYARLNQ